MAMAVWLPCGVLVAALGGLPSCTAYAYVGVLGWRTGVRTSMGIVAYLFLQLSKICILTGSAVFGAP